MDAKQKILLVDDRHYNLIALEKTLKETEAELVMVTSGNAALAAVLEHDFALALLDIQMPEMDGFELAELLRGNPSTKNLPLIFLTAYSSSHHSVFEGYRSGAVDFIVKPYDPDILLSKVRVFLELDAVRLELQQHRDELETLVEARTAQERDTAEKYSSLIESIGEIIYEYDIPNDCFQWKGRPEQILGYPKEKMGRNFKQWLELIHPDDSEKMEDSYAHTLSNGGFSDVEFRLRMGNGEHRWVHNMGKLQLDEAGDPLRILGILKDIDTRKKQEEKIQLSASVIEHSNEGVMITDVDNRIISVNPAFSRITGYSPEEVIGKTPAVLSSGLHDREYYQNMWQQLNEHGFWSNEIRNKRKNGETYPQWLSIISIKDKHDSLTNRVGVFSDLSDITEFKERLQYMAFYDQLTHLPNRSLLEERIQSSISQASRNDTRLAILFIDLDRFKNINDTLGHKIGDDLLNFISGKLKDAIRESDTFARFGGDEFVVVLREINSFMDAQLVAQKILAILDKNPFIQGNHEIFMSCSIGISFFPENGADCEALIKAADTAMYQSKRTGGHQFSIYMEKMSENFLERLSLENDLRRSLERNELFMVYQPQVDLCSHKVIGCEALIRWKHPKHGLIPPAKFIPLAEETGLIGAVGEYVLDASIEQAKQWHTEGHQDLRVSFNVSSMQLRSPEINYLLSQVASNTNSGRCKLELEITESTLMNQSESILMLLTRMRENGVQIAIDDFGTGYSSLNYIKQLPLDRLKVDQSFVRNIVHDKDDAAIVTTIISMAKNLDLEVIAEGVETVAQLEYLSKYHCQEAQGYLFSHPLPPEDISLLMCNGGIIQPDTMIN